MKPDWDKLMTNFADSSTALVADVDCTAAGKPLCDSNGVRGFPTIKYGDPSALEDYSGGRSYNDLKTFADENLKPMCSPANMDLCEGDRKLQIEEWMDMPIKELEMKIENGEKEMEEAEENFKTEVSKLQKKYEELSKAKDDVLASIKELGLSGMKSVKAHRAKTS